MADYQNDRDRGGKPAVIAAVRPLPVSYTHLDVYKRQLIPVGLTDKIVTVCRLLHIQVAASFAKMCIRDRVQRM